MLLIFVVLLLIVIALPSSFFLWGVSEIDWSSTGNVTGSVFYGVDANQNPFSTPAVSYEYTVMFKATGSFCANNKIHITIILNAVSLDNFSDYFKGAALAFAHYYPYNASDTNTAYVSLQKTGQNTY